MLRVICRPRSHLGLHINILPSLHSDQLQSSYSCFNSSILPSSSTFAVTSWVQHMKYSKISKQNKEETNKVVSICNRDPTCPPELFVVQPRLRPERYLEAKLNEALCLANSLEEQRDGYFDVDFFDKDLPPHVIVQNPTSRGRKARADTFFGPGTVDNIKCHLHAAESKGKVDAIFVNSILSGIQQRNLERAWDRPVLDRVGLIIEIFNAHAYTKEARLQAELAALMYKRTRLVRMRGPDGRYTFGAYGEAEVVSARGRGSGGRGFISGAGETELQLQRRRILDRRNYLISQIEDVRRTRALQRAGRKRHGGSSGQALATVAVVGLFATVDPRVRSACLPSGRKVLFSDTVGFISDLPIQLVEAFHATLEEVVEADLLVHVVDSTAPNIDEHRSTVLQVLQQIGVTEEKLHNMIEVWNKIDMEESVVAENCLDDVGNDENSDDGEFDSSTEIGKHDADGFPGTEDIKERFDQQDSKDVCHESPRNEQETVEAKEEYSNDWLCEDNLDDDGDFPWSWTADDTQNSSFSSHNVVKSCSVLPPGPHVKTSAVMGVGLQELLELIDEKLMVEDEKAKERMSEGCVFNRKWRPPRVEDSGITVEQ